jgi:hypothetical protein
MKKTLLLLSTALFTSMALRAQQTPQQQSSVPPCEAPKKLSRGERMKRALKNGLEHAAQVEVNRTDWQIYRKTGGTVDGSEHPTVPGIVENGPNPPKPCIVQPVRPSSSAQIPAPTVPTPVPVTPVAKQ